MTFDRVAYMREYNKHYYQMNKEKAKDATKRNYQKNKNRRCDICGMLIQHGKFYEHNDIHGISFKKKIEPTITTIPYDLSEIIRLMNL